MTHLHVTHCMKHDTLVSVGVPATDDELLAAGIRFQFVCPICGEEHIQRSGPVTYLEDDKDENPFVPGLYV